MAGATATFGFPYPTGTDRVMDGDNAIQALAEAIEAKLKSFGLPSALTVPGTVSGGSGSFPTCLFDSAGGEITAGYANSGGLAIAQGNVATHSNGVVLWVSGNSLYARKSNGTDVLMVT